MKLTVESKISDIFKELPQIEEILKPHLKYFYDERLDKIIFRKISLLGALKLINISQEDKEKIIQEFYKIVNKH